MTETRADVYTRITDQIAAAVEAGAGACRMPWHHDGQSTSRPINLASKRSYRGINVLALWVAADAAGCANGLWGTYRQWLATSAQVRKGERGTTVVLWKQSGSQSDDDLGSDDERPGRRVFHRIRHYGLLASSSRKASLALARKLLNVAAPAEETAPDDPSDPRPPCPCCGGHMIVIETFERWQQPRAPPTALVPIRELVP